MLAEMPVQDKARDGTRVLVAGGGTGGHLYPGIAVVRELRRTVKGLEVLFVGSARGIEAREVPRQGFALRCIPVGGLIGKGPVERLSTLVRLPRAFAGSLAILRAFRPHAVLGVGGYASGPTALTAFLLRIPVVIQEQNLVPGLTNRILGRVARRVAVSFEESLAHFGKNAVLTGNPVRPEFLSIAPRPPGRMSSILIFGGSQGARRINRAVMDALDRLAPACGKIRFTHQTGAADRATVEASYRRAGLSADVREFIDDMPAAMEASDIIVCRAGASTVSELQVASRAAVLVPLQSSAGGHQEKNARALERLGAARVIPETELDGASLAEAILALVADVGLVDRMSGPRGAAPGAGAAARVARLVLDVIGRQRTGGQAG